MMKWFLVHVFFAWNSLANVVGSDAQNFTPTQDGLDFVTVHSSETLEPGIFNIGGFINFAQNTFPAFEEGNNVPSQSLLNKNDSLTSADLNIAIGIIENWQVGLSLPYIINQSIDNSNNLGRFEGSGTSEIRLGTKYHLGQTQDWGFALAASVNFNRIDNNPYLGDKAGPTTNLEFIVDKVIGNWNWAANVGHRWRNPGNALTETGIDPLPNQWIASTAASYLFKDIDTKLIAEIYGSSPTKGTQNLSNRQNSSLEALLGAKYDLNQRLALHFGMGSELAQGTSTPDWRVYTGLNYSFGPVYSKPAFEERITEDREVNLTLPNLMFEFNSAELIKESIPTVDAIVARIQKIRAIKKIRIEGHTDSVGSNKYNQTLSEKRAETIYNLLAEKLKQENLAIVSKGFGEENPIADNGNFQGRQKNRRVEIYIENR